MGTLLGLILLGAYVGGIWKFWTGFHRTNFSQGKLYLALMWPVLLIANKSYRQNFNRALKG
ncbi:MAG: hypothetical protein SFY66_14430 [Oculatellaceae cyanobacterium bins.114]|nr:hypothetical protein [Oculatellaceae cyanobacterium bins.114]